jgi:hypothetical protein
MYPELFERNVNGSRSTSPTRGTDVFSRAYSNFRQFAMLSGCRRAGLHGIVKSEFVTVLWRNPGAREDYRRGFRGDRRWLMPSGSAAIGALRAHRVRSRRTPLVLIKAVIMLVCATADLVQGDGEFNPVTLLTYFCR